MFCTIAFTHLSTQYLSYVPQISTEMLLNNSFKLYAALRLGALASILNVREVSARVVGSSDIRENIKKSTSFTKVKGEECVKFEADITDEEVVGNVDVGILGCGKDLICLDDKSSSTGSRCVDSKEVLVKGDCLPVGAKWCSTDSDCCGDTVTCEILDYGSDDMNIRRCSDNSVDCLPAGAECDADYECCNDAGYALCTPYNCKENGFDNGYDCEKWICEI